MGVACTELCEVSGCHFAASYRHLALLDDTVYASRGGLADGSMSIRRSEYVATHCTTSFQQAGNWTVDHQRIMCFHSNQTDIHSILRDLDWHTMLYLSQNHDGALVALAYSMDEERNGKFQHLFLSIFSSAFGVLLVELQMEL